MWMKNVNSFQIAKVQAQGVARHLLVFFLAFSASPIKVLLIKKACSSATG